MDFQTYHTLVKSIKIGKNLPDALYLHVSAFSALPSALQTLLTDTLTHLGLHDFSYDLLKLSKRDCKLSLLSYPTFFSAAFPALHRSCTIDFGQGKYRIASYADSKNPPILHRKETFLLPEHPAVSEFRQLTLSLEHAGLLANARTIGFQENWERLLRRHNYQVVDGQLQPLSSTAVAAQPVTVPTAIPAKTAIHSAVQVARHRTAIRRHKLSVPMQTLVRHGYLNGDYSVFDYGCGQGDDVRELHAHGLTVSGWDPVHQTDTPRQAADVVNLGFVLNVIEHPTERAETLHHAFALANTLLVVAVMLGNAQLVSQYPAYGDGVLTQRNTFQKYYTQGELRAYLEQVLATNAIAIAPGVFYVFRDDLDEQLFLANRQRIRREWRQLTQPPAATVPLTVKLDRIEQHRALVDDFWQTCLELGRCPSSGEFELSTQVRSVFGSLPKAFAFVKGYYDARLFAQAEQARGEDILVYFALNQFSQRRAYTHLPEGLKRDIKALFGDYKTAQTRATELLFSVGQPAVIGQACVQAAAQGLGYLDAEHALTLHSSQLSELPAALRVYVGCATQLYGDVDSADLVKLHIQSGKVTLLSYVDFADKPLPELQTRIKINLRVQDIEFFEYGVAYPPQPLYFKSRYIPQSFAHYAKQLKFDEKLLGTGLFDFSGHGPTREAFYATLAAHRYAVRGFQLIRRSSLTAG